jgi:hypothetical protein
MEDAISRVDTVFEQMAKNSAIGNTLVSIVRFITDVVEQTAKEVKSNSGKKLSGAEKFELCRRITGTIIDSLLSRGIITTDLHTKIMHYHSESSVYFDYVSGIIEMGKQIKGCCC